MDRRTFIALAAGLATCPPIARAQSGKTYRVGLGFQVSSAAAKPLVDSFLAGLSDHGLVVGRNLVVDVRYGDGDARRLPAIAEELVALKPDVLAGFENMARILKAKTGTIPIVLTNSSNPVGNGLAQSLARPGGNVTGISTQWEDLAPKIIEIYREILPRLSRVGLLLDPSDFLSKATERNSRMAARAVGATLVSYNGSNRAEIEKAFADMGKARPDALLFSASAIFFNLSGLLAENCQRLKIPFNWVPGAPGEAAAAALFLFGPNFLQAYRDSARYVDRILKGVKPGDLPIEQPTKFELVVNLKSAKALGLRIPQSVLVRADRVIE